MKSATRQAPGWAAPLLVCALITPLWALPPAAQAAPSLESIKNQVIILQEQAAAAAEGAQSAKVQLAQLNRTLTGVKQEAAVQGEALTTLRKSLGTIAIEQYKSNGLSPTLELLFSANPQLYLSSAGSLEAITRRKSIQMRKFAAATQRLDATTLRVNDKVALVAATRARLSAQAAQAQSKLKQAEALLSKLKKEDRDRLIRLSLLAEDADQAASLAYAKSAHAISGRAGIALKFALQQIGDRYVFGAAGMTYWDCSGLTMRALQRAGISLVHSAAAQSHAGKYVPLNAMRAGDLVFFGRPISHVGIYLGNHKMLHAPRPGARVKITSFGSHIGSKRLVAARRF